jgi:hypothetical protein
MMSFLFQALQSYDLLTIIFMQANIWRAFWIVFNLEWWLDMLFVKSSFSLLSLPYVIPLLTHRKKARKILLIIPYSIIYVPLYTVVGAIGLITGIVKYQKLEKI